MSRQQWECAVLSMPGVSSLNEQSDECPSTALLASEGNLFACGHFRVGPNSEYAQAEHYGHEYQVRKELVQNGLFIYCRFSASLSSYLFKIHEMFVLSWQSAPTTRHCVGRKVLHSLMAPVAFKGLRARSKGLDCVRRS
jgi:hypothetical protein